MAEAPALESFAFIAATNCEPGDFEPLLRHDTLEVLAVGFGSEKKNKLFDAMVKAAGKKSRFEVAAAGGGAGGRRRRGSMVGQQKQRRVRYRTRHCFPFPAGSL